MFEGKVFLMLIFLIPFSCPYTHKVYNDTTQNYNSPDFFNEKNVTEL